MTKKSTACKTKFLIVSDAILDVVDVFAEPKLGKNRTDISHSETTTTLRRRFNFASCQVTTMMVTKSLHLVSAGTDSSSCSTQMRIENFADIEGRTEIQQMHQKLHALGGNPPPMPRPLAFVDKNTRDDGEGLTV